MSRGLSPCTPILKNEIMSKVKLIIKVLDVALLLATIINVSLDIKDKMSSKTQDNEQ